MCSLYRSVSGVEMNTTGEIIHTSLVMYRNWLETFDTSLSAKSAIQCGLKCKVRILSDEQKQLVGKIEALIDKKAFEILKDEL